MLPVAGLGEVQNFVVNETTALRDGAEAARHAARRRVEEVSRLPSRQRLREQPAESVRRGQLRLLLARRCAASRSSATAGSAACSCSTALIGEGVGELYVAKYFPPDNKAKMDDAGRESAHGDGRAPRRRCPGWTTPPAPKRRRSSPPSIRASATRSSGATTRRSRSSPASCSRTCATAAGSSGTAKSRGSTSPSIATSGA